MKSDIHPEYRPVVFQDQAVEFAFLTKSTIQTDETIEWEDGNTYPLAKVEISAASHPFFTGTMRIVDTAGRVERFERRFGRRRNAPGSDAPESDAPAADEAASAEEAAPVEAEATTEVEETTED